MPTPRFTVTYVDDRKEEIRFRPRAQIRYEADTGKPLFRSMGEDDDVMVTEIYSMAWYAAGKPDTLEEWLDNIDDVEMVGAPEGEGAEENPPIPSTLPD